METKIHYGCGRRILWPDWLNVDSMDASAYPVGFDSSVPPPIFRCDLTRPHPFPDNQFEQAFSEDFVEHLTQPDFIYFMGQVARTLKPGGIFMFCAPRLSPLPFSVAEGLYGDSDPTLPKLREWIYQNYTRWGHHRLITMDEITAVAWLAGLELIVYSTDSNIITATGIRTRTELTWPEWSRPGDTNTSYYVALRKPIRDTQTHGVQI